MNNEIEFDDDAPDDPRLRDRISGAGQVIIGELETIGGILTGDPTTQAEGEFNVEVGTLREQAEDTLEESDGRPDQTE